MTSNKRKGEIRIGIILLGVFLLYAAWNARELIAGPELSLTTPENGETYVATSPVATVTGVARRGISELSVNGSHSYVDQDGKFIETYALLPGENKFVVSAKDRFGREAKIERTVWLIPSSQSPSATSTTS